MFTLIQAGVKVFGVSVDPALLAFGLAFGLFGLLNFIEFKRFD